MRVLPIAAIYGGNASGKTNFFKALNFSKNLIIKGTQPDGIINLETFQLDDSHKLDKPSRFSFELLINEIIEELSEGMTVLLLNSSRNERFVITRKNAELIIKKLVTYHRKADGTEVKFEMRQESDGISKGD